MALSSGSRVRWRWTLDSERPHAPLAASRAHRGDRPRAGRAGARRCRSSRRSRRASLSSASAAAGKRRHDLGGEREQLRAARAPRVAVERVERDDAARRARRPSDGRRRSRTTSATAPFSTTVASIGHCRWMTSPQPAGRPVQAMSREPRLAQTKERGVRGLGERAVIEERVVEIEDHAARARAPRPRRARESGLIASSERLDARDHALQVEPLGERRGHRVIAALEVPIEHDRLHARLARAERERAGEIVEARRRWSTSRSTRMPPGLRGAARRARRGACRRRARRPSRRARARASADRR